jgi:hypothetical protein
VFCPSTSLFSIEQYGSVLPHFVTPTIPRFQADLLPPRLPYRIRFGILLSKVVTTRRHDIMSRSNSGNYLYHSPQNHLNSRCCL